MGEEVGTDIFLPFFECD